MVLKQKEISLSCSKIALCIFFFFPFISTFPTQTPCHPTSNSFSSLLEQSSFLFFFPSNFLFRHNLMIHALMITYLNLIFFLLKGSKSLNCFGKIKKKYFRGKGQEIQPMDKDKNGIGILS